MPWRGSAPVAAALWMLKPRSAPTVAGKPRCEKRKGAGYYKRCANGLERSQESRFNGLTAPLKYMKNATSTVPAALENTNGTRRKKEKRTSGESRLPLLRYGLGQVLADGIETVFHIEAGLCTGKEK